MEIKTCEQYVLKELETCQKLNDELAECIAEQEVYVDRLRNEKIEVEKKNEELEEFIKKLVAKIDFRDESLNLFLYSWLENEKELIDKLKEFKEEELKNE